MRRLRAARGNAGWPVAVREARGDQGARRIQGEATAARVLRPALGPRSAGRACGKAERVGSLLGTNVLRGLRIVRCKMRKEVLCVLVVLLGGWARAQQAPSASASPASYPTPPQTSPVVPETPGHPYPATNQGA